jgi:GNAT superfamily N-acetyltransferase
MTAFVIDELTAHDRAALEFEFRRLGEQSRYQRFQGIKRELTSRELEYLTAVDHWHHEALIARSAFPRAPIGVGRYVRGATFDVAEIAIEVVDGWQRLGVGRALLSELRERAIRAGIHRFMATMLADNRGALGLVKSMGWESRVHTRGAIAELEIDLRPQGLFTRSVALAA